MSEVKLTKLDVPCCIIGSGITGSIMSYLLVKNQMDCVIIGESASNEKNSSFLKNMSTYQSGILQSLKFLEKDFSKGEFDILKSSKKADCFRFIRSSRLALTNISPEINEFINKNNGVLNVLESDIDKVRKNLEILNYEKFGAIIPEREAKHLVGGFFKNDKSIYLNIPDTVFDLDAIVQLIQKESINEHEKYRNAFFINNDLGKIKIAKDGKHFILKFDDVEIRSNVLLFAAGFSNQKLLNQIDLNLKDSSKPLGFMLSLTSQNEEIKLRTPFFSRMIKDKYLSVCAHKIGKGEDDYLMIGNIPFNDIKLAEEDKLKSYNDIKQEYQKTIDKNFENIVEVISASLNGSQTVKGLTKALSFCIHTSGEQKYMPNYDFVILQNSIYNLQPGLATNCFHICDLVLENLKKFNFESVIKEEHLTQLANLTKVNHNRIKACSINNLLQRSWYKQ